MSFEETLKKRCQERNTTLCVGLDSQYSQISEEVRKVLLENRWASNVRPMNIIYGFNRAMIKATSDVVCSYKLNLAFYLEEMLEGFEALENTIGHILQNTPGIPVILDGKWGDTAKTNESYAKLAFDVLGADAVIVNPYFGGEALEPFLEREDKGVIIVCRTSNLGAKEFQDLMISTEELPEEAQEFFGDFLPTVVCLDEYVAYCASQQWNKNKNVLLVVGATYPEEMRSVRQIAGHMIILSPGIGEQSGDLAEIIEAGFDSEGPGVIPAVSRKVIFASRDADSMEAAGREAKQLRDQINTVRANLA